jgi:hypothetical protein
MRLSLRLFWIIAVGGALCGCSLNPRGELPSAGEGDDDGLLQDDGARSSGESDAPAPAVPGAAEPEPPFGDEPPLAADDDAPIMAGEPSDDLVDDDAEGVGSDAASVGDAGDAGAQGDAGSSRGLLDGGVPADGGVDGDAGARDAGP